MKYKLSNDYRNMTFLSPKAIEDFENVVLVEMGESWVYKEPVCSGYNSIFFSLLELSSAGIVGHRGDGVYSVNPDVVVLA